MAAFEYEALDAVGKAVKGVMEGDAERQVRGLLRERGLTPLRVDAIKQGPAAARRGFHLRRGLSSADLALLTRQFATLVRAGLTIEAKASIGGKLAGEARTPAAWRNGSLIDPMSLVGK